MGLRLYCLAISSRFKCWKARWNLRMSQLCDIQYVQFVNEPQRACYGRDLETKLTSSQSQAWWINLKRSKAFQISCICIFSFLPSSSLSPYLLPPLPPFLSPPLPPSLPTDNHLLHTALHHFEVLHTDHLEHIVRKHSRNVLFSTLGRWVAAVCNKMYCKVCTPQ